MWFVHFSICLGFLLTVNFARSESSFLDSRNPFSLTHPSPLSPLPPPLAHACLPVLSPLVVLSVCCCCCCLPFYLLPLFLRFSTTT